MAKHVTLLLSITRGGTHFVSDLLLSGPSVVPLIEAGIFWQLEHKSRTSPGEVVYTTGANQMPGYNFQFSGSHEKPGALLNYEELFGALTRKLGVEGPLPLSASAASSALRRRLGLGGPTARTDLQQVYFLHGAQSSPAEMGRHP